MRYEVKIRYNNTEITVKTSKKIEPDKLTLPEFLKSVRESYQVPLEYIHQITDYPMQECFEMENGIIPITKEYLRSLTEVFKLPRKIIKLGIDTSKSILANRICDLRIGSAQTQKQVSEQLGIAQTTYAGYETGKNEPDVNMLIKIAELYNVSLDFLMGRY